MATYTVANITDITGNADWTFDGSNNQIGATGVGLSIGAPSGGPVADSVNISGNYLINNVSVTAGLAPLASPTFSGTVTIPTLDVTGAATFATTLAVTGAVTLSDGLAVTGIVNSTGGFEIGGNSIYASPALTGVPTSPTAASGTNTTQIATTAFVENAVASFGGSPNANKLVNPFVEVSQINGANSISLTSGVPAYVVDGWQASFAGASGAVVSAQQVTDAPTGYSNSIKVTVSTGGTFGAGSSLSIFQPLEADNLIDTGFGTASAQSLALTFWLKASIAGVYSGCLSTYAFTRSYPFNVTLSAANTWQKFTVVIPGDTGGTWVTSGNAGGMYVRITAVAGSTFQGTANSWQFAEVFGTSSNTNTLLSTSGATFQLGPAKLEVATNATALIRTSIQQELAGCQRYYVSDGGSIQFGWNSWIAGSFQSVLIKFPVTMRATPTIAVSPGTGNINVSTQNTSGIANTGFILNATAASAGGAEIANAGYTANAQL